MVERAVNDEAQFEAERARLTLNSIGDAVMSTDVTGKITYLNPAAERITGWSREAAAGHPLEDVYRERLHGNGSSRLRKQSGGKLTTPD